MQSQGSHVHENDRSQSRFAVMIDPLALKPWAGAHYAQPAPPGDATGHGIYVRAGGGRGSPRCLASRRCLALLFSGPSAAGPPRRARRLSHPRDRIGADVTPGDASSTSTVAPWDRRISSSAPTSMPRSAPAPPRRSTEVSLTARVGWRCGNPDPPAASPALIQRMFSSSGSERQPTADIPPGGGYFVVPTRRPPARAHG
jgi:hypothetical protein